MNTRYVSSVLLALAGGFVVVASQAFLAGTVAWLAFAIGIAALVLALLPAVAGERSIAVLALDAAVAVLAAWTIVASLVFAGSTVTWLSFAEGLGFVAAALAGLTITHVRLLSAVRPALATEGVQAQPVNGHRTTVAA